MFYVVPIYASNTKSGGISYSPRKAMETLGIPSVFNSSAVLLAVNISEQNIILVSGAEGSELLQSRPTLLFDKPASLRRD